jgi:peptidyl-prolyl cis-trans isomerase-like 3
LACIDLCAKLSCLRSSDLESTAAHETHFLNLSRLGHLLQENILILSIRSASCSCSITNSAYTVMSVTLHTTHGNLKIEVFCESVPKTAENFLALCASGAYDATPFHRLIPEFMVQGGDTSLSPQNTAENPVAKGGMSIWGEYFEDEIKIPALRHSGRGMVSMANKGPTTNGSQFFITLKEAAHLDGKNTLFGRVIDGAEEGGALEKMEAVEVDKKYRPKSEKVILENITIHANPLAG